MLRWIGQGCFLIADVQADLSNLWPQKLQKRFPTDVIICMHVLVIIMIVLKMLPVGKCGDIDLNLLHLS